ncbi:MAG: hypothetical protein ACYC3F_09655 [Gemmatimonadaceae bacterium]
MQLPFSTTLAVSLQPALVAVWQKAVLASHAAKTCAPWSRGAAYRIKARCLSWVLDLSPAEVTVTDYSVLHGGIVGLRFGTQVPLHVRVRDLTPSARATVNVMIRFGRGADEARVA